MPGIAMSILGSVGMKAGGAVFGASSRQTPNDNDHRRVCRGQNLSKCWLWHRNCNPVSSLIERGPPHGHSQVDGEICGPWPPDKPLNQVDFFGFDDGQGAFVDTQFAVDVFDVVENRVQTDNQLLGNLFVLLPGGNEA